MEYKNERRVYMLLILIVCLVSFGLGYFMFKMTIPKETAAVRTNEGITLNAKSILPEDISVKMSYVGFAEAINQVQIIPYISGYIKDVAAKEGQHVQTGDLLITIDADEYLARLDAAKASVLQAQAAYEYNKNYYERVQKTGKKAFSEIETDNARNNFLQAQASLKNAEANQALAQVNFDYTTIKAPISGLIGNFTLSSGDYVSPAGGTLLTIVQTNPIRVVFSLTDTEYLNMKQGAEPLFSNSVIKLKMANGETFKYDGNFKYTDNKINKATNSLAVYAYFKNDQNELLPNSFVTVEVHKTFKNTVTIDKNFVTMQPNGTFLTIARNNKIQKIKVDILAEKQNQYVLKNTFETGDLLILDEVSGIKDNTTLHFNIIM